MELKMTLHELLLHWKKQNIKLSGGCSDSRIQNFESQMNIVFPTDFLYYFKMTNGMESLYPNDADENGFLFYPLQGLKLVNTISDSTERLTSCLIFANYMQDSWEYYVKFFSNNKYEIGIRPVSDVFNYITNSLSEFLHYYISDDAILYTYKI